MVQERFTRRRVLGLLAASGVTAACSPDRPSFAGDGLGQRTVTPVVQTTVSAPIGPVVDIDQSLVAQANVAVVNIYAAPGDAEPILSLDNPIASGGPLVFLIDSMDDDWMNVLLPVRPNGSTGFIHADEVIISRHSYRILVDLGKTNLTVLREGSLFFETRVAVAAGNRPTPGGRYYITELLQPPEQHSIYGSLAYGLSGFSEVLETFNGGPGQLGIHGTNDPDSIGREVSSGCVRMVNSDIDFIATFLPLGTPVEIFA